MLDAEAADGRCYVVNEWGQGDSLDILLTREGPLAPRRAAWLVGEVADSIAEAHDAGLAHGRLTPENVLHRPARPDPDHRLRRRGRAARPARRADQRRRDRPRRPALLRAHRQVGRCLAAPRVPAGARGARRGAAPAPGARRHPARARRALRPGAQPPRARPGDARDHSARAASATCSSASSATTPARRCRPGRRPPRSRAAHDRDRRPRRAVAPERVRGPEPTRRAGAERRARRRREPSSPSRTPVEPDARARAPSTDLPTEAGMPVFHDDDEVDWLRARAASPPPPPPLDELPPKPLFAPDPPRASPYAVRAAARAGPRPAPARTRPGTSGDSGVRPVCRDTGAWAPGRGPRTAGAPARGSTTPASQVPGRSWFRLAMIVAVCLLVLVAAVAAYQLGLKPPARAGSRRRAEPPRARPSAPRRRRPRSPDLQRPTTSTRRAPSRARRTPTRSPTCRRRRPEHDVDARRPTSRTSARAGSRRGVGLVVDLGAAKGVRQVVVTTVGRPDRRWRPTSPRRHRPASSGLTPVGDRLGHAAS